MQIQKAFHLAAIVLLVGAMGGCATGAQPAESLEPQTASISGKYSIINVHDHMQSTAQVKKFLKAMDAVGITHTILMGSPKQTIYFKGGFVDYDLNNAEMLTLQVIYPDRFSAFPTMDPRDPDKLRKFIGYVRAGAKGLKLYSGHSLFYDLPLTDHEMEEVYAYLEDNGLPVMFHINLSKFLGEFEAVMAEHPKLIVILPHLGLSSIKLTRLESLMERYPTILTDLSFGYDPYLKAGLRRISKNVKKYREFVHRFPDRILYGTDIVVTSHKRKTAKWLTGAMRCYRDMLETAHYKCSMMDDDLNGLELEERYLRQIYETNPRRLLDIKESP